MRFSFLSSIFLAASAAIASPTAVKRQASVQTVYKFSGNGAWAENLAVRSNGQILVTRLDLPELWTVNPSTKAASKVFTFSEALGAAGITEVSPDVFAVLTGNFTTRGSNTPGSWAIWKVDLTTASPTVTRVKLIANSGMFNGLTTLNNDTVLIGDGAKGAVFRFSLSTGEDSIAIQDATMAPPQGGGGFSMGIDGLRFFNGSIYFTNIFKNTLSKVAVDSTGKAAGSVTLIANLQGGDDLAVDSDGSAYVTSGTRGQIIKVTSDGKSSTLASVSGPAAVAFGRGSNDKRTLYIATSSGSIASIAVT